MLHTLLEKEFSEELFTEEEKMKIQNMNTEDFERLEKQAKTDDSAKKLLAVSKETNN